MAPAPWRVHVVPFRALDRTAVISDIHGNVPALEAVLTDIERRGIRTVYCLGDLVGKGPQSALAVDICRGVCEGVVRGNWDDVAARPQTPPSPTLQWHREQLGEARLRYLEALPNSIDLLMSGKRVRLFHASPEGVYTRVYLDVPYERQLEMFTNTPFTGNCLDEPDVVGYGDIHVAGMVSLYRHRKTLFNVGSVGNPLDEPLATYAILEGVVGGTEKAPFSVQLVRLPYEVEDAIAVAVEMNMPELKPYAKELRTAVYRMDQGSR